MNRSGRNDVLFRPFLVALNLSWKARIALIIKAIFVFSVSFGDTAAASSADLCHQKGVGDGQAPRAGAGRRH